MKPRDFTFTLGIDRIKNSSNPKQWNYVPSLLNPADDATRGINAENLAGSKWLNGPINLETYRREMLHSYVITPDGIEVCTLRTEIGKQQ